MNSFVVKLFVFLTEVLSVIIIGLVIVLGVVVMVEKNVFIGLAVAVGGTVVFTSIFGFAAIFIEIHKDLRAIREIAEMKN
jgi:hypothetical protein